MKEDFVSSKLYAYEACDDGFIDKDERDYLLDNITGLEFVYDLWEVLQESEKDLENFLKKYKYDERTGTILLGNRKVHIKLNNDDVGDVLKGIERKGEKYRKNFKMTSKERDGINHIINGMRNESGGVSRFSAGKGMPARKLHENDKDPIPKTKISGISLNTDVIKKLNEKEIESLVYHELGHLDDYSAKRRNSRIKSPLLTFSTNDVPQDKRKEFIACRSLLNSKKELKGSDASRVKHMESYLEKLDPDKAMDYTRKKNYDSVDKDVTKGLEESDITNAHDNDKNEIKADLYSSIHTSSDGLSSALNSLGNKEDVEKRTRLNRSLMNNKSTTDSAKKYMK